MPGTVGGIQMRLFQRVRGVSTGTMRRGRSDFQFSGVDARTKVVDWSTHSYTPKVAELAEGVLALNAMEALEFSKYMQTRMGVTDEVLWAGGGGGGGGASQEKEEVVEEEKGPATVKLTLTAIDDSQKIKIMKEIRAIKTELKLMEVKSLVDKLPSELLDAVEKDEADGIIAKFKELGATIEAS